MTVVIGSTLSSWASSDAGISRSTFTVALPSGSSRYAVMALHVGNPASTTDPPTTSPTLGGVAGTLLRRAQGGTNVMNSSLWGWQISDGSSGDLAVVHVKSIGNESQFAATVIASNVSWSGVTSAASAGLGGTPSLLTELSPYSVNSDMVVGFFASASGVTVTHTQEADGTAVTGLSSITVPTDGGGTAIYNGRLSVVTVQGDSAVSFRWSMSDTGQRWRLNGVILPFFSTGGGGSTLTAAVLETISLGAVETARVAFQYGFDGETVSLADSILFSVVTAPAPSVVPSGWGALPLPSGASRINRVAPEAIYSANSLDIGFAPVISVDRYWYVADANNVYIRVPGLTPEDAP